MLRAVDRHREPDADTPEVGIFPPIEVPQLDIGVGICVELFDRVVGLRDTGFGLSHMVFSVLLYTAQIVPEWLGCFDLHCRLDTLDLLLYEILQLCFSGFAEGSEFFDTDFDR